ncbi:Glutathione S-transferase domain protein [Alloalcanivorax dieselolei B5]|uniref:glutathione transferase n=1 Tax=Alcanivorax dieselolei (strain DSM 16502 / CGMCC 1.3690 / MCCC 1A00001 / B-5) TaxID=930169 RepID=K0CCS5_ALCDB|nr:glutathione S-transferase [Alloalcanivorax dieselolei]AFT69351.1 Glutathione S-transferase domain protein [Alloalcanivorax dieselolei B5]GGJ91945.1 glutathione S-transferase [Alloalcanivorax dieselolei]
MITVHHLENSRSLRVLWLLEELGLPYEIVHYKRDPVTMLAPESLRKIHPLGKAPILQDDDRVVAESGAILEYLLDHHGQGRFRPEPGAPGREAYQYWLHYAEGSLMPLLVMKLVFSRVPQSPMPFFIRPVARKISQGLNQGFLNPRLSDHLGFVERHLGEHAWFAGDDFSAADIQMSFPLQAAQARAPGEMPNIRAFIERLESRPAYRRAEERGGALKPLG